MRDVMERAGSFSAVSGFGLIAVGAIGVAASVLCIVANLENEMWLTVWAVAAFLAGSVGSLTTLRKARAENLAAASGPGRKFFLCLMPALIAGAILTVALVRADQLALVPAMWLLLYGAGMAAAGTYSVRPVALTGLAFIIFGGVAMLTPGVWSNYWMGAGFGGLHILLGALVLRKHGG